MKNPNIGYKYRLSEKARSMKRKSQLQRGHVFAPQLF